VTGDRPLSVLVGGDLVIDPAARFDVSASEQLGGPAVGTAAVWLQGAAVGRVEMGGAPASVAEAAAEGAGESHGNNGASGQPSTSGTSGSPGVVGQSGAVGELGYQASAGAGRAVRQVHLEAAVVVVLVSRAGSLERGMAMRAVQVRPAGRPTAGPVAVLARVVLESEP